MGSAGSVRWEVLLVPIFSLPPRDGEDAGDGSDRFVGSGDAGPPPPPVADDDDAGPPPPPEADDAVPVVAVDARSTAVAFATAEAAFLAAEVASSYSCVIYPES